MLSTAGDSATWIRPVVDVVITLMVVVAALTITAIVVIVVFMIMYTINSKITVR